MVPTGNFQVSYKFFCLDQGKFITRRKFTKMEIPERVIKRVNRWGTKSKKMVFGRDLTFCNRNREKFEWDGDDDLLEKPSYQKHPVIASEFPGVVLQIDQVSLIPAIEELIQDENIVPAEAIANSFIPGVDTTAPRQHQSWADVVINRPTTLGVDSHHQPKLKIKQDLHTSNNTRAPPGVLSAENTEDADYDNDADSDEDKTSGEGDSYGDLDNENDDPPDGIGDDTPTPDTRRRSKRLCSDQQRWGPSFSNDRYAYAEPTTGPRYKPGTDGKVFFQMANVIKDTFLAN